MLKNLFLLTTGILVIISGINAQKLALNLNSHNKDSGNNTVKKLDTVNNTAFKSGEYLKYLVYYGWIDAGEAELIIEDKSSVVSGRTCYHVIAQGRSLGITDWVYKVRDKYETYIDQDYMLPWKFVRSVREGGYKHYNEVDFDHYNNKATSKITGVHAVPDNIQDVVSAFYYARCAVFNDKMNIGDTIVINTFFDDQLYSLAARYLGKESVETDLGEFNCLKFNPMVQEGRMFKAKESIILWISDDGNYIPVRVESEILVGSVKFDLVEYSGLKNKLSLEK